jgi:hypothetical protein
VPAMRRPCPKVRCARRLTSARCRS